MTPQVGSGEAAAEERVVVDPAAEAAVEQVRRAYLGRDWWACARDGASLQNKYPDSVKLRAWTIACGARAGDDVIAQAEVLLAERPGDPWAMFAVAMALVDHGERGKKEAIPAARAALAVAPAEADMVWLVGRALVNHGKRVEAAAWFAEHAATASAQLLALEMVHESRVLESTEARIVELAERARALDPAHVDAEFVHAQWLLYHHRVTEAVPPLVRALALSPYSPAIRSTYWEAILRDGARSPDEKRAAIDADVALLLRERGDSPAALKAVSDVYETMSPETHEKYAEEVVKRFPTSSEADWVLMARIRRLEAAYDERKEKGAPDPAADAALLQANDDFLARGTRNPMLRADAYMRRWGLLNANKDTKPEALLAAVKEWAPHEEINTHMIGEAARELAERTDYDAEAEALVREAIGRNDAVSPGKSLAERGDDYRGRVLAIGLGAVQRHAGKLDEARATLEQVYAVRGDHGRLLIELAAVAEAQGRHEDAEKYLIEGLDLWDGDLCEKALKEQYARRHGGERGWDRYKAKIDADLRERRKAKVLATAIAEPKPLAPFTLPRLGGGAVDSASLAGKVAVINLWSTSCHPCVEEMPDLQQLANKFARDRGVVVTTINIDPVADELPKWMTEHALKLEVLLGGRYVEDNAWRSFPTTLFVDPQGRIAFKQEGATRQLVEEFGWRVEALRAKRG